MMEHIEWNDERIAELREKLALGDNGWMSFIQRGNDLRTGRVRMGSVDFKRFPGQMLDVAHAALQKRPDLMNKSTRVREMKKLKMRNPRYIHRLWALLVRTVYVEEAT